MQCLGWGVGSAAGYSGGREWLADLPARQGGDPSGRWQNFNHFMKMMMRGAETNIGIGCQYLAMLPEIFVGYRKFD